MRAVGGGMVAADVGGDEQSGEGSRKRAAPDGGEGESSGVVKRA